MQLGPDTVFELDEGSWIGQRTGTLSGSDWRLRTPAVVPVGPLATEGSLASEDLAACGVAALGVDWLRLCLRPGVEAVRALGGFRRFAGWSGPTMAGSAAWAFARREARVREKEASVISPSDGSTHRLTPETAIEVQLTLGLDVVAALDWPDDAAKGVKEVSSLRLAWAERSLSATKGRALVLASLPVASSAELARELGRLPVGGFILDGTDGTSEPRVAVDRVLSALPASALRVVDWRNGISGLAEVVSAGLDVIRLPGEGERARQGAVLTREGELSALSDAWMDDPGPLEAGCDCPTCRRFGRAYVRHLFAARELLGPRLVETHNLSRLAGVAQTQL